MNFLAPLVAVTTLSSPLSKIELNMVALTPQEVETKLDSIILFTPIDKEGIPMSLNLMSMAIRKKYILQLSHPPR